MAGEIRGALLGWLLQVIHYGRRASWFVRRPITIGVRTLVLDGDQVLLVRAHGQSRWHLPGGAIKRDETLAECARRETLEETGCQVEIDRLLGMYFTNWSWKSDHVAIFVAHPRSPITLRPNIEIAAARYFPVAALPSSVDQTVRRRLADYHNGATGIYGDW